MEHSSFFNSVDHDRLYKAEDWANYFGTLIANGLFPDESNENLRVLANVNMGISVMYGKAWINGYFYYSDSELELTVNNADGSFDRIDIVVVGWNHINRNITTYIKTGTASTNPTIPELQRDEDVYELCLARIYVTAGTTVISTANITDTRSNVDVCGYVEGVVNQIPPDGSITTAKLADNAVTFNKLGNYSVGNIKLGVNAVGTSNIQNNAVTTSVINDNAVTTLKIADKAVTGSKISTNNIVFSLVNPSNQNTFSCVGTKLGNSATVTGSVNLTFPSSIPQFGYTDFSFDGLPWAYDFNNGVTISGISMISKYRTSATSDLKETVFAKISEIRRPMSPHYNSLTFRLPYEDSMAGQNANFSFSLTYLTS